MRKLLLVLLALLGSSPTLLAQLEYSTFTATGRGGVSTTFATDYQSLGINPANLGVVKSFRDPLITLGFGEVGINFMAEAIPRREMLQAIGQGISRKQLEPITYEQKIAAGQRLAGTDISTSIDHMPVGISIHLPGNQGFAVSVRNHTQMYMNLNSLITDVMFTGATSSYFDVLVMSDGTSIPNPRHPSNQGLPPLTQEQYEMVIQGELSDPALELRLPQLLKGSRVSATVWNEFNFGYGKRIYDSYNLQMFLGADIKYISGILLLDLDVAADETVRNNYIGVADNLTVPGSQFLAFNPNVRASDLIFPKGVSKGVGYDLGFTAVIKKNLTFGMALANARGFLKSNVLPHLGQIISSDSLYSAAENAPLEQSDGYGLDSYNLLVSNPRGFGIAGEGAAYQWGSLPRRYVELPATFRVGMSYNLLKTAHFGFDVIIPLNDALGNPSGPMLGFGGDFRLSRLFRISSGFNATIRPNRQDGQSVFRQFNIPLGITYTPLKGFYETGIATRDITTYIGNPQGSTISFAAGFLRFKIGQLKNYRG